jgi:hypothetical protein
VFASQGRNVLQFFPDGRIYVHGKPVVSSVMAVEAFRWWLASVIPGLPADPPSCLLHDECKLDVERGRACWKRAVETGTTER